jgi:hypothetical protein
MRTAIHHLLKNRYHLPGFNTGPLQGARPSANGPLKSISYAFGVLKQHLSIPPTQKKPDDTLTEVS